MNIVILKPADLLENKRARLNSRQTKHIRSVLKSQVDDWINIGELNGKLGRAQVCESISDTTLELKNIELNQDPPRALNFKLILALPRPQMLKRILQTVAMFGVKELSLIQTSRVEKSFWQTPSLSDESINEQLILGLEQAKATQLPNVSMHKSFKTFIQDQCPNTTTGYEKLLANIGDYPVCPTNQKSRNIALAIGPEGGLSDYEVAQFETAGFKPIQIGERVLKVETAVTALLGRLI